MRKRSLDNRPDLQDDDAATVAASDRYSLIINYLNDLRELSECYPEGRCRMFALQNKSYFCSVVNGRKRVDLFGGTSVMYYT